MINKDRQERARNEAEKSQGKENDRRDDEIQCGSKTYRWLGGRACRLKTTTCHAHGQSSEEEVEKLHDDFDRWIDRKIQRLIVTSVGFRSDDDDEG